MRKLDDLTTAELMAVLADIAEPVANFAEDDEFFELFRKYTARGMLLKQRDTSRFLMRTYGRLVPMMIGEKHINDTMRILAAVTGTSVKEMMAMKGKQTIMLLKEAMNEYLTPFFTQSAPTEKTE